MQQAEPSLVLFGHFPLINRPLFCCRVLDSSNHFLRLNFCRVATPLAHSNLDGFNEGVGRIGRNHGANLSLQDKRLLKQRQDQNEKQQR